MNTNKFIYKPPLLPLFDNNRKTSDDKVCNHKLYLKDDDREFIRQYISKLDSRNKSREYMNNVQHMKLIVRNLMNNRYDRQLLYDYISICDIENEIEAHNDLMALSKRHYEELIKKYL